MAQSGSGVPGAVATRDVGPGDGLTRKDLHVVLVDPSDLPAEATRIADVLGRVVDAPILAGQPVRADVLAPEGTEPGIEVRLARLGAVRLPLARAGAGVGVGDRVDVVWTTGPQGPCIAAEAAAVAAGETADGTPQTSLAPARWTAVHLVLDGPFPEGFDPAHSALMIRSPLDDGTHPELRCR